MQSKEDGRLDHKTAPHLAVGSEPLPPTSKPYTNLTTKLKKEIQVTLRHIVWLVLEERPGGLPLQLHISPCECFKPIEIIIL